MLLPRPIKKMIAVFRGGLSPLLIILSVCLGFTFGLIPGWTGIHTFLIILLLLLNIHVGLFLISAGLGKSLCFAAVPLMYHLGTFLQQWLGWLFAALDKIPIIGLTDFSRYSVSAAVIAGPVIGIIAGLLFARLVSRFRARWLKLEEGSEAYKKWSSKKWVKILDRILIGKRTKDVRKVVEGKSPVIRKAGFALAGIMIGLLVAAGIFIKDEQIGNSAASALTKANGAEVNIGNFNLSPLSGSVSAGDIEVTNPENPSVNQFTVQNLSTNAGIYPLLCGRIVLDEVHIKNVTFDTPRQEPGKVVETASTDKSEEKSEPSPVDTEEGAAKLEKYFKNAKKLKETLKKIRRYLPSGKKKEEAKPATPESYLEYISASAPVAPSARIFAEKVLLEKVKLPSKQFGLCDIKLTNVSDAPAVVGKPVKIEIKSTESPQTLNMTLDFSEDGSGKINGDFANLELAVMQSQMSGNNGMLFDKGLAAGDFSGTVSQEKLDLTINMKLTNLNAKSSGEGMFGLDAELTAEVLKSINTLDAQMKIAGPPTAPRIAFNADALKDQFAKALEEAGKKKLQNEFEKQIDKNLGDKLDPELKKVIGEPKKLLDGIGGLLGGKKED